MYLWSFLIHGILHNTMFVFLVCHKIYYVFIVIKPSSMSPLVWLRPHNLQEVQWLWNQNFNNCPHFYCACSSTLWSIKEWINYSSIGLFLWNIFLYNLFIVFEFSNHLSNMGWEELQHWRRCPNSIYWWHYSDNQCSRSCLSIQFSELEIKYHHQKITPIVHRQENIFSSVQNVVHILFRY